MVPTQDHPQVVTTPDLPQLVDLSRDECLHLLGTRQVGRVAVTIPREGPLVVPVNYVLDDRSIIFRSGYGTKLRSLPARPISFQVDHHLPEGRVGWSVLARGMAREISRAEAAHLVLEPWVPQEKHYWVRMEIHALSGRRIARETDQP